MPISPAPPRARNSSSSFDGTVIARLRRQISSKPSDIRSGSMKSNRPISSLNTLARPPVAITFMGSPYSSRMRLIRLSISPT